MSGRIIPTILGKAGRLPGVGPRPTFCSLMVNLGTVMAPLGVSFHLLIEDQGLVEVDLSTILDLLGSNQFMSCPRAVSFLKSLCPVTFPLRLMGQLHSSTQSILSTAAPGPQ